MDVLPDQVLRNFTAFYDRIEQFVANLTPDTDLKQIEDTLPPTYLKTFGVPGMDEPLPCTREEALAGLRQSIASGNKVHALNRAIRMRSATEAVVFVERVAERGGKPVGRTFHVEDFRLLDGSWQMVRETMEVLAP